MANSFGSTHLMYYLGDYLTEIYRGTKYSNLVLYDTDQRHRVDTLGGLEKTISIFGSEAEVKLTPILKAVQTIEQGYPSITHLNVAVRDTMPAWRRGLMIWITCLHSEMSEILDTFFSFAGTPDRFDGLYHSKIDAVLIKYGKAAGPKMIGHREKVVEVRPGRTIGTLPYSAEYTFREVIDSP